MSINQVRAAKGTVGIEEFRNKLRLRLPRNFVDKGNRYISTGLENNPENFSKAQIKAWEIESDIHNGQFDVTLAKYQLQKQLTVVLPLKFKTGLKIDELWERYTEYKAQFIEQTTIKTNYKRILDTLTVKAAPVTGDSYFHHPTYHLSSHLFDRG